MNVYRTLLIANCLLAVGCHGGVQTDVMQRELRLHEDRIYELEDYVDQYQALLDSCRRENRALKRELGMAPSGQDADDYGLGEPRLIEPRLEFDDRDGNELDGAQRAPRDLAARLAGLANSPELLPRQGRLHQIHLNKLLSGGLDADGQPGDEGVLAVLEPRSAEGKLVREPGQVSLMIRDATRKGPRAQLARWDFESDELCGYWRKSPLAEGYVFELPWPANVPQGGQLQLWARLITDSGQKYLTHLDIDVQPGGSTVPPIGQFRRAEGWMARKKSSDFSPASQTPFSPGRQAGTEKTENRAPRLSKRPAPSAPSRSRLREERTERIEVPPERPESSAAVTEPVKPVKRPLWKPDR